MASALSASLYGGLGAEPPVGSRGKAPGGGQGAKPPEAESFSTIYIGKFIHLNAFIFHKKLTFHFSQTVKNCVYPEGKGKVISNLEFGRSDTTTPVELNFASYNAVNLLKVKRRLPLFAYMRTSSSGFKADVNRSHSMFRRANEEKRSWPIWVNATSF